MFLLRFYEPASISPELDDTTEEHEEYNITNEFKTPMKTHSMFAGTHSMGNFL